MVIVIGASSFIGVYTVDLLLREGYDVLATGRNPKFRDYYANKGVKYIEIDICKKEDFTLLPCENVEACVLLAALLPANDDADLQTSDHAEDYIAVNTLGTIYLLEYCRRNGIKKVISTTSYADVYGQWSETLPFSENTPRDFSYTGDHCEYIISKNAATDFLIYYNNQYHMQNIIFRLPPVYGVGPHGFLKENGTVRKSGIQIFIEKAKEGLPITIYGDGTDRRDIVYVKDVAFAIMLAIQCRDAYGLYNIGSGETVSLYEQAKAIVKVFSNKPIEIICDRNKKNNIKSYCMSIEKAKKEINYKPNFASFIDMMRDWKKEEEEGKYTTLFS